MEISTFDIVPPIKIDINSDHIIALPVPNLSADIETYFSSTPSLVKHLNRNNLKCDYYSEPTSLFEQRGAEWFGPTLLILSNVYNSNPEIFSALIDALKNHVADLFPSNVSPVIKLDLQLHKDGDEKSTIVRFEGGSEHLPDLLKTIEKTWKSK